MSLKKYREKRDFKTSSEPAGRANGKPHAERAPLIYAIQKHRATQLHYDFRLEHDGVLLSWAVPKGPSLDPSVKRLAMQVEDHPREYAQFEGVIPEGEYGGGTVMLWDVGTWTPEQPDIAGALAKGDLKFTLHGKKLRGSWVLVRTNSYQGRPGKSWLLIKHRDAAASTRDITVDQPHSVLSKRLLADIARQRGGDVAKAATGDPKPETAKRKLSRKRPVTRK